ncbi:MAG: outer membrane beta-barrel protein, partial [Betaproteobacteria bacterium]|nr:outer membrane beta-barrel protein [Betaproteobacteria bacterium]
MRALLVALLMVAGPAWAQGYFGASIGQSDLEGRTDTAARGFGGYQFKPSFAMEGGYQALGTADRNGRSASISAIDFGFVGSWELGNRYALLGRVGAYRAETSGFGTNLGPIFGVGVSYDMTHNATFRLEWTRYDKLGPDTYPNLDIDVLSIGAVYRF